MTQPQTRQAIFNDMLLGTLLYSVVLGFFNDYTSVLHTTSYSTTFLLAIVMQLLTVATFRLKDVAVARLQASKALMAFGVWFIMFTSKFVFLGVISLVFREDVHVSGFVGLLVIIVVLTVVQKLIELLDGRLQA